jgi:glutamate synthase (NADPH/NADH) large chain
VVVLGETGRNFAAGMSGGIAYVLDEAGDFESRCNMAMVELEPITGDATTKLSNLKADMLSEDAARLRTLLENHARYTNSKRAQDILADWEAYLPKFHKVMPTEYRRALNEMAEQNADVQPAAGE